MACHLHSISKPEITIGYKTMYKIKPHIFLPVLFTMAAAPALASPVLFNFDNNGSNTISASNLPLTGPSQGDGLNNTASSATISTYMTDVLHSDGYGLASVKVTGALATATYTGDGNVDGYTLGNSNYAGSVVSNGGTASYSTATHNHNPGTITDPANSTKDGYLINNNFGINGVTSNSFTITFSNFIVSEISFDFEIFPDIDCAAGSSCARQGPSNSDWPDMELLVNGNPVPLDFIAGAAPSGFAPQGVGQSGWIDLSSVPGGVTSLEFVDWPAEIGIDNLQVIDAPPPSTVPEPSTLPLFGLALGCLIIMRRRLTSWSVLPRKS